jgi:hypothetical protein
MGDGDPANSYLACGCHALLRMDAVSAGDFGPYRRRARFFQDGCMFES